MSSTGAGKGDKPRNCFSKQFKDNYDLIKWNKDKKEDIPAENKPKIKKNV